MASSSVDSQGGMMRSHLREHLLLLLTLALPLFVAIYAPLSLLSINVREMEPGDSLRSVLFVSLLAIALTLGLAAVYRNLSKGVLLAAVILLLLLSYGHIYNVLKPVAISGILIGRHRYLVALSAVIIVGAAIGIWRHGGLPRETTTLVSLGALCLVLWTAAPIAGYHISGWVVDPLAGSGPPEPNSSVASRDLPDIYYIVLDSHGRADALSSVFGYDGSDFFDFLRRRGFFVADESLSNYAMTAFSLGSTLNMDYLDEIAEVMGPDSTDRRPVEQALQDNAVFRLAKSLGYSIVVYESAYGVVAFDGADIVLRPNFDDPRQEYALRGGLSLNPFEGMLLETTIGRVLFDWRVREENRLKPVLSDFNYQKHRMRILYQFESLPQTAEEISGPKFVFVHVLAPHAPFVFGAEGQEVEQTRPFSLAGSYPEDEYREGYADQVRFLDRLTELMIDGVIASSASPPIIILQGDTGSGVPRPADYPADRSRLQHMAILNAYLVPEDCQKALYPQITPVNTFRVVFGECLGADIDLIEDRSLYSTYQDPYEFVEVHSELVVEGE